MTDATSSVITGADGGTIGISIGMAGGGIFGGSSPFSVITSIALLSVKTTIGWIFCKNHYNII